MSRLRILCRVVTHNPYNNSILLVRNKGQKWWCAPGGGWDHDKETLAECAMREVKEETGVDVAIEKYLFAQTLNIDSEKSVWLEHFWLGRPIGSIEVPEEHIDHFGVVDEACWFTQEELESLTVYPLTLKHGLWQLISPTRQEPNRYIGHFHL